MAGESTKLDEPQEKSVSIIALGCSKNIVDSEMILGSLLERGFVLTGDQQEADVVVINTCGFIGEARQESIDTIVGVLDRRHGEQKVVVAGCLSQRYASELLEELPEIDAMLGINAPYDITKAVENLFKPSGQEKTLQCHQVTAVQRTHAPSRPRFLLTPKHYAYLRIADGCDQGCRFCAIPRIRGRQRSRSLDELVSEAKMLADQGCQELNLVAHDLNSYGVDFEGKKLLGPLLERLNEIKHIKWIRCFYLYPAGMTQDQIEAMCYLDKVLPYIDMPLQHISDHVLKEMNRRVTKKQTLDLLDQITEAMPEHVFRTTLLVGYPGETDDDFSELINFVSQKRFTHMGAFAYSREEGTAAYHNKNQISQEVIGSRLEQLMLMQQDITFSYQDSRIGSVVEVICDEIDQNGRRVCRSWAEGPDCDPVIYVEKSEKQPGDFFSVRLVARDGYDLIASDESA